ncbi:4Fe-4S binding protein [uncultured Methanobacterium sp.]|uniref:arsenate reductase/protein-tyrosine-phosphatase family protein n=1 Tax=uncultured Methanobacterium sp. TaxID=176306 RepID=UPI002AA85AB4|nr:4Fe-4S binding protein [uncultured Methanobacterium sp.]
MVKERVLFLCTHNAARSQIAEGVFRDLHGDVFEVYSAGIKPQTVNPLAIKCMEEIGIDISHHKSKHMKEFQSQEFDYIITVCENACPLIVGGKKYFKHSFEDPSAFKGTAEEKLKFFAKIRDEIKDWLEDLYNSDMIHEINADNFSDLNMGFSDLDVGFSDIDMGVEHMDLLKGGISLKKDNCCLEEAGNNTVKNNSNSKCECEELTQSEDSGCGCEELTQSEDLDCGCEELVQSEDSGCGCEGAIKESDVSESGDAEPSKESVPSCCGTDSTDESDPVACCGASEYPDQSTVLNPDEPQFMVGNEFLEEFEDYARSIGINSIGYTQITPELLIQDKFIQYPNTIVLNMEMNKEIIEREPGPEAQKLNDAAYAKLADLTYKLSDYLRQHGFATEVAHPYEGVVNFSALGQKAGLGYIGQSGLLISPELGPRQKVSAIFVSIANLPHSLGTDHSWIPDYCDKCGKCVRACPEKALIEKETCCGTKETELVQKKCIGCIQGCTYCIEACPFTDKGYDYVKNKFDKITAKMKKRL